MTCTLSEDTLEAFWEGRLDAAAEEGVREHVGGCRSCRQRLSGLNAVDRCVRATVKGWGAPSPGFNGRVMARVMAAPAPRAGGGFVWGLTPVRAAILAAAATVVVAVSLWAVMNRGGSAPGGATDSVPAPAPVLAATFYEPVPAAPLAVGKPFVIREDGKADPAPHAGTIRVTDVVRGVPVLLVDAFPEDKQSRGVEL